MESKVRLDDEDDKIGEEKPRIHPIVKAGILSKLFFCWALPIFVKGYKKDLTPDDLYLTLEKHKARYLGDKLEASWLNELNNHQQKPSLWRSLFKVYAKPFIGYGFWVLIYELVVKIGQPLLLGRLMAYYTPGQTTISTNDAYLFAGGIVFISLIKTLLFNSYTLGLIELGLKIRIASCSLIYRKALRLSKSAMETAAVGQMVNIMSNDVNRFDQFILNAHHLVIAPLETLVIIYLLYVSLDPSALAGVVVLLSFIPLQTYIGKKTAIFRRKTAFKTDTRVRLMNEIITGIQVIKMYTWEKPFAKLVELCRKYELHEIRGSSYLKALNASFVVFLSRGSVFLCIMTYALTRDTLTAEYVYVVTSFYGNLRETMTINLPQTITQLAETKVSVKRIKEFLLYDEIAAETPEEDKDEDEDKIGVSMEGVCAKWKQDTPIYSLSNVTFNVNPQQLVAIVGPVGSGKTTLLQVILKEVSICKGSLEICGKISYASQEPWLFAGSVRENILFGQEYDRKKYRQVIQVCALERDFTLFPFGDRTVVGERGVMLSGGQKARINLARAVYKDADLYLLDDPLSAVDAHVGKQLYQQCINGYLKNKAVVLVTHQLQYLNNADRIYLLENGMITTSGTYSELQNSGGDFVKLLDNLEDADEEDEKKNPERAELQRLISTSKSLSKSTDEKPQEEKEHQAIGAIQGKLYIDYFKAGRNNFLAFFVTFIFFFSQFSASINDLFINFWVNLEQEKLEIKLEEQNSLILFESDVINTTDPSPQETYKTMFFTTYNCIYIQTFIICAVIVTALCRSLLFYKFCIGASKVLHNNMFSNIVGTTMRFFNTNPSGRILNRFAKDVGAMDEILPNMLMYTIQLGINAVAITCVLIYINPANAIPTAVILVLFYFYKQVFMATSRDLKRIESTTRSPMYTHLTASLQGLSTIRAFKAQEMLKSQFDQHQDTNSAAFYLFQGCSRTFAFWMDINCIVYIGAVIFSFFLRNEKYGGNVGLAISQSMSLTLMLQYVMRTWSELQNQMTSIERIIEYTNLPHEPETKNKIPIKTWPEDGAVEFVNASMQYGPDKPYVLKGLSLKINAGEKVGIVGRTGAGKSSLISALFRLAEIEGTIKIDEVDTQKISLNSLRSKISIIPQEPVLFSGTMRKNLDPFDEYNDDKLWEALDEVNLKTVVADLPLGLLCRVSESGSNFSVGQRQLVCLARAILRSNKILVLDEATANVDPQTDEFIQNTIRRKFKECTVLTIAHRLHTVMDSDKILFLDAGRLVEFNHPYLLLEDTESHFYGLVQETGKVVSENLHRIAKEAYDLSIPYVT